MQLNGPIKVAYMIKILLASRARVLSLRRLERGGCRRQRGGPGSFHPQIEQTPYCLGALIDRHLILHSTTEDILRVLQ